MSVEAYLKDTEPAVRHLFKGLDLYDSIKSPSIKQFIDDTGHVRMSKKEADEMVELAYKSLELEFSRAILAGSILQVAYTGLKEYPTNKPLTPLFKKFGINPSQQAVKFCIGRTQFDIPIGLLIYSGRIQYNHWEEGIPGNKVAKKVFLH